MSDSELRAMTLTLPPPPPFTSGSSSLSPSQGAALTLVSQGNVGLRGGED